MTYSHRSPRQDWFAFHCNLPVKNRPVRHCMACRCLPYERHVYVRGRHHIVEALSSVTLFILLDIAMLSLLPMLRSYIYPSAGSHRHVSVMKCLLINAPADKARPRDAGGGRNVARTWHACLYVRGSSHAETVGEIPKLSQLPSQH